MDTEMKGEIGSTIQEASKAMENLILSFERHIDGRESSGASPEELQRLSKGFHTIRDSAGIYLSWARHFAKVLGEEEGEARQDLEDFMDEGADSSGNPMFGP
jgi:hypothetical protein